MSDKISGLWSALKAECCQKPDEAKTIVFLSEEKFRKAIAPLLDSDSQAVGDAQRLAFAIESAAVKAGIIEARQHSLTGPQLLMLCDDLATATTTTATSMRDKCVEKLNAIADEHQKSSRVEFDDASQVAFWIRRAASELTSLTLDQVKPGEM